MKIVIIGGAGAMGGVFGGLLAKGGHQVTLVDVWAEAIDRINREGLRVERKTGGDEPVRLRAVVRAEEAGPADLLLVFTKCYDTEAAVRAALPAIGPATLVLSLQNGWGNAGRIAGLVGAERVLLGVTYHSAGLLGPGRVMHNASGPTHVGSLAGGTDPRAESIAAAFNGAGVEALASPVIREKIWAKLALNVCSLPTAALLRCLAGDLRERAGTRTLMQALLREVAAVAQAMGIPFDYDERWTAILAVLEQARTAKPSMLQDVEKGRRTEIDVINGAILAEGRRLGIATPYNESMVLLIQALEAGYARPAPA